MTAVPIVGRALKLAETVFIDRSKQSLLGDGNMEACASGRLTRRDTFYRRLQVPLSDTGLFREIKCSNQSQCCTLNSLLDNGFGWF
jgi:hypothetical protein